MLIRWRTLGASLFTSKPATRAHPVVGASKVVRILNRVMIFMLFLALVPTLCITQTSPTYAYELWGYEWDDVDPLNYWIPFVLSSQYWYCWSDSVVNWDSTATDVDFVRTTPVNVYCSITVESGAEWDGLTSITVQGSEITDADCYLNTYYTGSYTTNQRRSVASHEIGHSLGLDDTSGAVVMNGYTDDRYGEYGVYTAQQDDIDGVNAMY